jgi:hypothetical protein
VRTIQTSASRPVLSSEKTLPKATIIGATKSGTSAGPVYFGALVFYLFILGSGFFTRKSALGACWPQRLVDGDACRGVSNYMGLTRFLPRCMFPATTSSERLPSFCQSPHWLCRLVAFLFVSHALKGTRIGSKQRQTEIPDYLGCDCWV